MKTEQETLIEDLDALKLLCDRHAWDVEPALIRVLEALAPDDLVGSRSTRAAVRRWLKNQRES